MALVIDGMPCPLCGEPLRVAERDEIVAFRPFSVNEADPLHPFSDRAFHRRCLKAHPLAEVLQERVSLQAARNQPWPPECHFCGRTITSAAELLPLPYFAGDPQNPLEPFNYRKFHIRCFASHPALSLLLAAVGALVEAGTWDEESCTRLLRVLTAAIDEA